MKSCCSFLMLLGRLCIAAIFLVAGLNKFMDYEGTAQLMTTKGVPYVPFSLYASAIIEILGALSLIFGFKTRLGAILLALFLIPVTAMVHDFWNVPEASARMIQMAMFMKNVAIFGGLLYVISNGAGRWACDHCCHTDSCATDSCCVK